MEERRIVWRHDGATATEIADRVAEERPLDLRVDGETFAVIMRSPGHDDELAVGFLVAEGVVRAWGDLAAVTRSDDRVDVTLAPHVRWDPDALRRSVPMGAACGVCGRASLDAIALRRPPPPGPGSFDPVWLAALPDQLRARQPVFDGTGGVHAVGLARGQEMRVREDVGRHNAFDKVVGAALRDGTLGGETIAVVSGRASFELVQKAVMAGLPGLVAVGAPTTLAMTLAAEHDLLLIGFCRGGTFTVYAGIHRLRGDPPRPAPRPDR